MTPGGPGQVGAWATGRKMAVGAAVAPASKVWFTVAEGILSEVYYPTLDNPDVGSLQYVVTDGHTTWRESADTVRAVRLLHPRALAYRVTNTAHDGSYRITTDYCADPARSVLLPRSRFEALRPGAALDRLYVVFQPNMNGTSLTNTATVQRTESGPALVATSSSGVYGPAAAALLAQPQLGEASVGFRGAVGDPWAVLRADHRLTSHYLSAARGTVVGAAAVALQPDHQVTLALGFGQASAGAIAAARAASNHHHFTSPLLVRGHAQPGTRVLIALYTVDSQRLFSVLLSPNGDFARALPLGLSENVIVVLAVDARGNSSVERRTVTRQL